jgi:hypothetical protein
VPRSNNVSYDLVVFGQLDNRLSPNLETSETEMDLAFSSGTVHPGGGSFPAAAQAPTVHKFSIIPTPLNFQRGDIQDAKASPPVTTAT